MGLFSHSVTTVGTTASRVIDDKLLPDSVKTGAMRSLIGDDNEQLVEYSMEELLTGLGNRGNRMYDYGKSRYVYGLPSSTSIKSNDAESAVKQAIQAAVGGSVVLNYYHLGSYNNLHLGWQKLVDHYGYNTSTNEITSLTVTKNNNKVYLKDMVVVVTEATLAEMGNGSLDRWGVPPNAGYLPNEKDLEPSARLLKAHSPFMVDPAAVQDYVKVTYVWEEDVVVTIGQVKGSNVTTTNKVVKEDSFKIVINGFDSKADYHQVMYTSNGTIHYWTYLAGSGEHPTIDEVFQPSHVNTGTFFPFGYFRYNKVSMGKDKNDQAYKSSKKLMSYVGIDYDQLIDSIHSNPDIDQVENAMMIMAVPADTTNPLEQKYLYDFFDRLTGQSAPISDDDLKVNNLLSDFMKGVTLDIPVGSMIIQDKRFKMALTWRNVFKHTVTGSIGKVDSYSSGYSTQMQTESGVKTNSGAPVKFDTTVPCHYYRRQLSETLYEEIQVYNLKMVYYVFEGYTAVGENQDAILLIPLDHSIARNYPTSEREVLYARSMHYVFNSRVVTHLKWYETGIFKLVVTIIAVVVTILSLGSTWETIVAALAAGASAQAIVIFILIQLLEYLVITLAVKLFVKTFGQKVALIAALTLAIFGGYQAIESGSLQGAPWASDMLRVASGLTNAVSADIKNDYMDLLRDREDFNMFVKSENKKLEEANKLLDDHNPLIPLIVFGEKPQEYYDRTVHSGNIGVLCLDAISSYVDISLMLPKLNTTVGDTF